MTPIQPIFADEILKIGAPPYHPLLSMCYFPG